MLSSEETTIIGSYRWTCKQLYSRVLREKGLHFCNFLLVQGNEIIPESDVGVPCDVLHGGLIDVLITGIVNDSSE